MCNTITESLRETERKVFPGSHEDAGDDGRMRKPQEQHPLPMPTTLGEGRDYHPNMMADDR